MKKINKILLMGLLLIPLFIVSICTKSSAAVITFTQITSNSGVDYSSFFNADVSAVGSQVLFKFNNASIGAISETYFDNRADLLGSFSSYSYGGTVFFTTPATPPGLPSGNTIIPAFNTDFSFQSARLGQGPGSVNATTNRVNNGEWLGLTFNIASGISFADIENGLNDGGLRLGMHVQSLLNGNSEAFVTSPPSTPVPEPGTMMLLGSGLVGLAGWGRKKFQK